MAKIIEGVVDTYSNRERLELINYVSSKELHIPVISDFEGFSLVGVYQGFVGLIGTQVAKNLVDKGIRHFQSVNDYVKVCEEK